jgi:hypothetical protein
MLSIRTLARTLSAFALVAPVWATTGPDGVCSAGEQALGLCFQSPGGFVVEAVCGPDGEFPVLDEDGNSRFEYLITGPGVNGGSCAQVHDVSHSDILIPICGDAPLVLLEASPSPELLTNGHGDPSCDFGSEDKENDVLKWDAGVGCEESLLVSLVIQGSVGAAPTTFLIKAGNACSTAKILGPSCDAFTLYCFGTEGCRCGNDDPSGEGGCANATGLGARLRASGSTSVASDDLVLTTDQLPAGSTAWLIMGRATSSTPFEDGFLCIGLRQRAHIFPPQLVGASGIVQEGPGIAGASCSLWSQPRACIVAGSSAYFQTFYRDPAGMVNGCWGKNFSNALAVTFH